MRFLAIANFVREDTHKKSFSGRTTKGVGRVNPPDHLAKNQFFSLKSDCFSQKIGKKRKSCQNPFQAIIRLKKKKKRWHGPLSHWCREGKTLVVRPLKKHFF